MRRLGFPTEPLPLSCSFQRTVIRLLFTCRLTALGAVGLVRIEVIFDTLRGLRDGFGVRTGRQWVSALSLVVPLQALTFLCIN